jgi:hypothetical protein
MQFLSATVGFLLASIITLGAAAPAVPSYAGISHALATGFRG